MYLYQANLSSLLSFRKHSDLRMEHLKIEIIFQSFPTVILSEDQSEVLEGSENLLQSLISVPLIFLQPVPSAEIYKIVSNGGAR